MFVIYNLSVQETRSSFGRGFGSLGVAVDVKETTVKTFYSDLIYVMQGNVEIWLGNLLKEVQHTIHCIIRQAFYAIEDSAFKMLEFQVSSFQRLITFINSCCYCFI